MKDINFRRAAYIGLFGGAALCFIVVALGCSRESGNQPERQTVSQMPQTPESNWVSVQTNLYKDPIRLLVVGHVPFGDLSTGSTATRSFACGYIVREKGEEFVVSADSQPIGKVIK